MNLKLDKNTRKFIDVEIELDSKKLKFTYFEKVTKQIKEMKKLSKAPGTKMYEIDELSFKQFFDNFKGEKEEIEAVKEFYEENGNFYDFINLCDEEMGKLKKKA